MNDEWRQIGAELSQGRQRQDLSLIEISDRTKISLMMLRAIERGDLKRLPGGIFTRAYLREYARQVGSDPEDIVRRYCAGREQEPTVSGVTGIDQDVEQNTAVPGSCVGVHVAEIDAMDRRRSLIKTITGLAVILFGGFVYFASIRPSYPDLAAARPATKAVSVERAPVHQPAAPPVPGPAAANHERSGSNRDEPADELQIEVEARGECWLSATADGQKAMKRLISAGLRTRIAAREEAVLRIGDAANCGLNINGAAARPLGAAGEPVTLHITRHNYREFIER